jgi:hypothetical protein
LTILDVMPYPARAADGPIVNDGGYDPPNRISMGLSTKKSTTLRFTLTYPRGTSRAGGTMQQGKITRAGIVVGTWRADERSLAVESDDAELRQAAAEIVTRARPIPVHGPEHYQFAAEAVPVVEAPATVKYLALVALELEARGYTMEPDDEE